MQSIGVTFNQDKGRHEADTVRGSFSTSFVVSTSPKEGDYLSPLCLGHKDKQFWFSGQYHEKEENFAFLFTGPRGYPYKVSITVNDGLQDGQGNEEENLCYTWKEVKQGVAVGDVPDENNNNFLIVPLATLKNLQATLLNSQADVIPYWCAFGATIAKRFFRMNLKIDILPRMPQTVTFVDTETVEEEAKTDDDGDSAAQSGRLLLRIEDNNSSMEEQHLDDDIVVETLAVTNEDLKSDDETNEEILHGSNTNVVNPGQISAYYNVTGSQEEAAASPYQDLDEFSVVSSTDYQEPTARKYEGLAKRQSVEYPRKEQKDSYDEEEDVMEVEKDKDYGNTLLLIDRCLEINVTLHPSGQRQTMAKQFEKLQLLKPGEQPDLDYLQRMSPENTSLSQSLEFKEEEKDDHEAVKEMVEQDLIDPETTKLKTIMFSETIKDRDMSDDMPETVYTNQLQSTEGEALTYVADDDLNPLEAQEETAEVVEAAKNTTEGNRSTSSFLRQMCCKVFGIPNCPKERQQQKNSEKVHVHVDDIIVTRVF